jgi:hypothetical protein
MNQKKSPPHPVAEDTAAGISTRSRLAQNTSTDPEAQGLAQRHLLLHPTEDDLALAFAERHEGKLAFVEELTSRVAHRWYIRDGDAWVPDKTLRVPWLIRELCAEFRKHVEDDDPALRLGSRDTFIAVELIARCDPRLARTREDLGLKAKPRAKKRSTAEAES